MINALFLVAALQAAALPQGYETAKWGMTLSEIRKTTAVVEAKPENGYSYGDHTEVDPDVYVQTTPDNKRIEYYFFEKRLYKVYVIYDPGKSDMNFYQSMHKKISNQFGPHVKAFDERVFGMPIKHILWEDDETSVDLRYGAGFVYEVRVDKATAARKARQVDLRNAI